VGPVQKAGAVIAVPLVEELLDDADGEKDSLPVLQHALMRIWRERRGRLPLV